jgi:hypothetical protein
MAKDKTTIAGGLWFKSVVISKQGSALKVERIVMPKGARAKLVTGVTRLPAASKTTVTTGQK